MAWDTGYISPEEQAAQDRAQAEARQRAQMQPFERSVLNVLGEISASLARLTDFLTTPLPVPEHTHTFPLIGGTETRIAAGDGGDVSAEPVDRAGPGSAHPNQ
jgi:hypothetical protein